MTNKPVSLMQLVNLVDDSELSKSFVSYSAGFPLNHQYKHQEVKDISKLLDCLKLSSFESEGFLFGYTIPQLNKEFDLLKITNDYILNIELKSQQKDERSIENQLFANNHYLKLFNKTIHCFSFVSSNNNLYKLEDGKLCRASFEELKSLCSINFIDDINLDKIFAPKNILVSPLNDTERFLAGDYLLTENQENIKKKILSRINNLESAYFVGLTGGPGTGKTLLLYDIAKQLASDKKVLLIHSGILCDGHYELEKNMQNLKIIEARELKWKEINNVDYVLVDEAQRLYEDALEKVKGWVNKAKTICVLSYDPNQRVSHRENDRRTVDEINSICGDNKEKLTAKIRTNKEIAEFINCLRDLNHEQKYNFDHVRILFEPDGIKARELANVLEKKGYQYIAITPSFYDPSLDYQNGDENTHTVIGQEFDKVCMIMDSNFYYENGKLKGKRHPNPDYIFTKLLYEGITRARSELAIIITDKNLLGQIMVLFKEKDNNISD